MRKAFLLVATVVIIAVFLVGMTWLQTSPPETPPSETLPPETPPSETLPPETSPSEPSPYVPLPYEPLPSEPLSSETSPPETSPSEPVTYYYDLGPAPPDIFVIPEVPLGTIAVLLASLIAAIIARRKF